jgi:hypothetical protein
MGRGGCRFVLTQFYKVDRARAVDALVDFLARVPSR